ncbi:MAG: helix-turn-helix domain-containing protein [Candidatus Methanomethylicaceae archaeon]
MDVEKILERLRMLTGVSTDAELAKLLGVKPTAVYNWRIRNKISLEPVISLCEQYDLSPSFVLYGVGPERMKDLRAWQPNFASLLAGLHKDDIEQILVYVREKARIRKLEKEVDELKKRLK